MKLNQILSRYNLDDEIGYLDAIAKIVSDANDMAPLEAIQFMKDLEEEKGKADLPKHFGRLYRFSLDTFNNVINK